jgi:ring-1,2-phenylacetyl-CoA epoxidase subunit PaaD
VVSPGPLASVVREALAEVTDPELPVLTIEDLGVLRDVKVGEDGRVEVTITPTYSGCPAIDVIRHDVERVLAGHGWDGAVVRTVLSPAWTTDWMSDDGRRRLREFGIAPPGPVAPVGAVAVDLVRCPRCGSAETRLVSRFGSTPCMALRACRRCLEPFDHFKPL